MAELTDAASTGTLDQLVRDALETMSASERKVARALLAHYPIAGLETVAELAQRASVSPPTVVRFVTRLGFDGFNQFQRRLMREVHERLGSPLEQYSRAELRSADGELARAARITRAGIADTVAGLPASEFERAVELLADTRHAVRLIGGRFSRLLAQYLCAHLMLLRQDAALVDDGDLARLAALSDLRRGEVVVVFDYRRYDPETVRFAEQAAERGASVVLFTDRWLSPAADVASTVLPSEVESPSPFDSLVPALMLVEAVIAGVTDRLGEAGRQRVGAIEALRLPAVGDQVR